MSSPARSHVDLENAALMSPFRFSEPEASIALEVNSEPSSTVSTRILRPLNSSSCSRSIAQH
jgi:hypothetical protein